MEGLHAENWCAMQHIIQTLFAFEIKAVFKKVHEETGLCDNFFTRWVINLEYRQSTWKTNKTYILYLEKAVYTENEHNYYFVMSIKSVLVYTLFLFWSPVFRLLLLLLSVCLFVVCFAFEYYISLYDWVYRVLSRKNTPQLVHHSFAFLVNLAECFTLLVTDDD